MSTSPHIPPGAPGNTHHPRNRAPLTHEELARLRCRPPHLRAEIPAIGAVVGYRADEDGPVVPAAVVRYADGLDAPPVGGTPDPSIWMVVTDPLTAMPRLDADGRKQWVLVPDPWLSLVLRIDPPPGAKGPRRFTTTREARLDGSPGWLPAAAIDWRK